MNDAAPGARAERVLFAATLGLGIVLRGMQWLANPSLWIDEAALAWGIVTRGLGALLHDPLPAQQTAPPGVLVAMKLAVAVFPGPRDAALRALPLGAALVALAVFAGVARRLLRPPAAWLATFLFATALPLIVFGATAKQYSSDICVAVLLTRLGLALADARGRRRRAAAAVGGAALAWFSQPAAFVLGGVGLALLLDPGGDDTSATRRRIAPVVGAWALGAAAAAAYALALATPAGTAYARRFWSAGFPPPTLHAALASAWPWDNLTRLFGAGPSAGLDYPWPAAWAALALVGLALLVRRWRTAGLILTLPLGLALAAAALRVYPFFDRLLLFALPALWLGVAAAAEPSAAWLARRHVALGWLLVGLLAAPAVRPLVRLPPPFHREDVRPVLAEVRARWQPGDAVYVYYGAAPAVAFYAADFGFARPDYRVGGCHRGDTRAYLRELDGFRGRPRVWVVLSHATAFYGEDVDLLRYLDAIGVRRAETWIPPRQPGPAATGAGAFLFDLSDPRRLASTDAATMPLTRARPRTEPFTCEGPQSLFPSDLPADGP